MKKTLFLLLLLMSVSNIIAQEPTIAVYVINNDSDNSETQAIKKVLGDKFVEAIVQSGHFRATERTEEFLAQIRKEREYQRSGNVSDREISKLAQELGAKYLCITDVFEVFGEKYVTAKLIEVEINQIIAKVNSTGSIKSMDDLVSIANEVTDKLIKETPQEQAAVNAVREEQEKRLSDEYFVLKSE